MLFSRVISFFAVSLSLGTLAVASPAPAAAVAVAKRDNAAIEAVFTALKSSTDSILPQISMSYSIPLFYAMYLCLDLVCSFPRVEWKRN